jgi:hypothetical protein
LLDRIELLDTATGSYQAELEFERGEDQDAHVVFEVLRQNLVGKDTIAHFYSA